MGQGFEESLERAWREFRESLADAMERLGEEDELHLRLRCDAEGNGQSVPHVIVSRDGDEVVVDVPTNRALDPRYRLSRAAMAHLRGLGLYRYGPMAPTYVDCYPETHVDQAASVAVSALREAFDILHPAMLESTDRTLTPEPSTSPLETAGHIVEEPRDAEHLDRMVVGALTAMLGEKPHRDRDGDLTMLNNTVVYVRVQPRRPLVHIFSPMVLDVTDAAAAQREVARLNCEIDGVKFIHLGEVITVTASLAAIPFVPAQLKAIVAHMDRVVSDVEDEVARAVGGRTQLEEAPTSTDHPTAQESPALHPVMARLLQLDALAPGSLTAGDVAKLCHHDDDVILELIGWNEEQVLAWTDARDDALTGDRQDEADACERERAHAERTVQLLRQTLHLVLLGETA